MSPHKAEDQQQYCLRIFSCTVMSQRKQQLLTQYHCHQAVNKLQKIYHYILLGLLRYLIHVQSLFHQIPEYSLQNLNVSLLHNSNRNNICPPTYSYTFQEVGPIFGKIIRYLEILTSSIFMDKQGNSFSYQAYIGGPILFTAPHSKKVMRGGQQFGIPEQEHHKQIFTGWIASQIALLTRKGKPNSFIIWNAFDKNQESKDHDPNYMKHKMFAESPFHLMFHAWGLKMKHTPMLHIDIHGKKDTNKQCQIDIGTTSIVKYWGKTSLRKNLIDIFDQQGSQALKKFSFDKHTCKFNSKEPAFGGYWGQQISTMSSQAIQLGIPSLQMQIPTSVRTQLFKNPQFMQLFAGILESCYEKVIIPWFESHKKHSMNFSGHLASAFKPTLHESQKVEEYVKKLWQRDHKFSNKGHS